MSNCHAFHSPAVWVFLEKLKTMSKLRDFKIIPKIQNGIPLIFVFIVLGVHSLSMKICNHQIYENTYGRFKRVNNCFWKLNFCLNFIAFYAMA